VRTSGSAPRLPMMMTLLTEPAIVAPLEKYYRSKSTDSVSELLSNLHHHIMVKN
jgi:hypothetical protein